MHASARPLKHGAPCARSISPLGPLDAAAVADALPSFTALQALRLVAAAGAAGVCTALRRLAGLRELDLSGSALGGAGEPLGAALGRLTALVLLRLAGCGLESPCFGAVARAVAADSDRAPLATLDLADNKAGREGAYALADAVARGSRGAGGLRRIEVLELGGNRFGRRGFAALVRALPRLAALRELGLGYNGIDDGGATALGRSLSRLAGLRRLGLHCNELRGRGALAVARAAEGLPALEQVGSSGQMLAAPLRGEPVTGY